MADADVIRAAKAVTEELNHTDRQWAEVFTAERVYDVAFPLSKLEKMQVVVVGLEDTDEEISRGQDEATLKVWIDFQKKVKQRDDPEEVDRLINFVQSVKEFFGDRHDLTGMAGWKVEDVQFVNGWVFVKERLFGPGVYEAALELEIQGYR